MYIQYVHIKHIQIFCRLFQVRKTLVETQRVISDRLCDENIYLQLLTEMPRMSLPLCTVVPEQVGQNMGVLDTTNPQNYATLQDFKGESEFCGVFSFLINRNHSSFD